MVVGLVVSSNHCHLTPLLLSSIRALNSNSSKLWVWLNSNRVWGLLQGRRVSESPQWVNLDLEEQGSQGNLEARLVWVVSSFPTS